MERLTEAQRLVLLELDSNESSHLSSHKTRTRSSLQERGLITWDLPSHTFWITEAGRRALGR